MSSSAPDGSPSAPPPPPPSPSLRPGPAPVAILHLDARLVVVDKPAGLLVHRTRRGADEDALLQRVRDQLGRHLYPVHRLDRPTSGLVVFGLDPAATAALKAAVEADDAGKEYVALARGACPPAFERRDPLEDERGVARAAWTEFARLAWLPPLRCSLVRARLHTGRQHQVRRHLALAGHAVIGDRRYGTLRDGRVARARVGLRRMALHAVRLDLAHPDGGRLRVAAPLPEDLRAPLVALGAPPALLAWLDAGLAGPPP